jgi:hypothetical protein
MKAAGAHRYGGMYGGSTRELLGNARPSTPLVRQFGAASSSLGGVNQHGREGVSLAP